MNFVEKVLRIGGNSRIASTIPRPDDCCCSVIVAAVMPRHYRHVFKNALQVLAERPELEIRGAHYPPYCSKYNSIETGFFSHITCACQGVMFHRVAIAKQFMENTKICKGLKVTVDIMTGVHVTGKKCAENILEKMRIIFDDYLPRWNYRAAPQTI